MKGLEGKGVKDYDMMRHIHCYLCSWLAGDTISDPTKKGPGPSMPCLSPILNFSLAASNQPRRKPPDDHSDFHFPFAQG